MMIETFNKMKEVLMERGWCQDAFQDDEGQVCIVGSLYHSDLPIREGHYEPIRIIESYLNGRTIMMWNDTKGRTFNEVIELIDAVILAEKEKGNQ